MQNKYNDSEYIEKTLKAGKIVNEVFKRIENLIKPGKKVIELCENIENVIINLGGKPAFPCNISIDNMAAHYTSPPDDQLSIPDKAVVKVDIGVHIDGYIVDAAKTFSFNPKYDNMVEAVEMALNNAIKKIKPGVKIKDVAREIERTITSFGYKPISNLTGHLLRRYLLHGGKGIPNVYGEYPWSIEEGEVYAIEPFATDGAGKVIETNRIYIYSIARLRSGKTKLEKDFIRQVHENFKTLPFCKRWLMKVFVDINEQILQDILERLIKDGTLTGYPVLREIKNGVVTQIEATVIVTKDGVIHANEI
ncbi:MAG: type II methionyl aminopeptidase [Candidatus Methanomethylicia archaeon]|nr:type II methionyl aminopeptidase [Candidatus Methanomethylicia archaeon]MCX8169233.1 type II methionyl aminopeptidase [Candidatus Methanomethylicia archaeon]MDW7988985.1 type II methionyl aminopeptidase [Nitrososphaerota archaeon]